MHAEWADVGASVPISLDENRLRRCSIAGTIALDKLYRTSYITGKQRTDCRAEIGTEARVWDESLLFPRHTPPRAGPRLQRPGAAARYSVVEWALECTAIDANDELATER